MIRFTCSTAFMLLLVSTSAQNEDAIAPTQRVLSIHENYPIFENQGHNVTKESNTECQCEEGFDLTESQWNSWSSCTGQKGDFECHQGIRYRSRPCQSDNGSPDICLNREWRHCYHQRSCTGQWVEWLNPNAACSRSCGGGIMYKVKICQRKKEIGLFCESDQRTPYDIHTIPCNTRQCPIENQRSSQTTTASDEGIPVDDSMPGDSEKFKKNQEKTTPQPVNAQMVPNVTTWIAAGVGGVAVLLMVIITICVSRRKNRELRKSNDYTELDFGSNNPGLTVHKSSNRSSVNSQAISTLSSRPSNPAIAAMQISAVSPDLHHSFDSSKAAENEKEVYTFPSTPQRKWTKPSLEELEAAGYMESTTDISKVGKSTQDCIQRVKLPADSYLESSRGIQTKDERKKGFDGRRIKDRTKTTESMKTTTFEKLSSGDESQLERPESHIYAEITPQIGLAV